MNELSGVTHRTRVAQFLNTFYLGGAEGQVVELLRALRERYEFRVAALQAVGPLLDEVRALGFTPAEFRLRGSLAHPATVAVIVQVAKWLNREKIDLLHIHDYFAAIVGVPAAKLARCRVVVGRLDLGHWHSLVRARSLAAVTRAADHVVANADAIRRSIISRENLPSERVSVILNGIDLRRFDERLRTAPTLPVPRTDGAPIAILVANMNHPVKRQEDFLVALAHARAQGSAVQGFLVGDGPRRRELEGVAEGLGLRGAAHFLGHRTDVPALLSRSTVGVLCSTAEGLSNAVIEGMAARLPMVVTDVGGNPELITEERGVLISPKSPFDLSAALTHLLERPDMARRLAEAARRFVEAELTLDRMAQKHDELYRRLTRPDSEAVSAVWQVDSASPSRHIAP